MATQNQSSGSPSTGATAPLDGGKRRYIIASRRGMAPATAGVRPMSAAHLRGLVKSIPGIEVERVIQPHRVPATFAVGADEATDLYVVKLAEDQAEMLRQSAPPNLIVEEDAPLGFGEPAAAVKEPPETVTWKAPSGIKPRTIRFKVLGDAERPLKDATVTLCGEGIPVQGRTDAKGELSLELYAFPGDRPKSVFVSAECNHWSRFLPDPELSESGINTVRLASLEESIKGFPEQYSYGWGAQLMGLDRLDRRLTGKGVKIAIIDSGADNRHPLLKHVQKGVDLANGQDPVTWCEDHIGHGTHCAGTICAQTESGSSLRGFAPGAEIHIIKVFPGGRYSTLIEALDLCIERKIDVVNISLGCDKPSLAVEQMLEECALNGIACIVAAGSTGRAVQYPASSPWTLAVSAIGRFNEYPPKTWERTTVLPGQVAPDGVYSPTFTCFGPEVAVCAPGVGIISTVPHGGFEPQSGSSVAAPHVTGLAALLLAHHPWFAGFSGRNHLRVGVLFNMIRSMCIPYAFAPGRAGAGLPTLHALQQSLMPSSAQTAYGMSGQQGHPQPFAEPFGTNGQFVAPFMPPFVNPASVAN